MECLRAYPQRFPRILEVLVVATRQDGVRVPSRILLATPELGTHSLLSPATLREKPPLGSTTKFRSSGTPTVLAVDDWKF